MARSPLITDESNSGALPFVCPARTSVPYTYCIWYRPDPENPAFLEELSKSPPDLYHLGYQAPFKGGYGPAYGGELYTDDILPPDEVAREQARIRRVLKEMRAAGVTRVIPYVFTMAFFGEPDERRGFFRFYDHWDDYRGFGLGPKPDADPALWSQVRGPHQLGDGPEGILHYDPCVNHPGWLSYLDLVVEQMARVGYDGVFFDVNTLYCFCPQCQARFDLYLYNKYGRNGLQEAFGTADHRQLKLSTIYPDFKDAVLDGFKAHLSAVWDAQDLCEKLGVSGPEQVALESDSALLRCHMQGSLGEFPPAGDLDAYLRARFGAARAGDVADADRADFVQTVLRREFQAFLGSPSLADALEAQFGSADLKRRCVVMPKDMLLWVETQRFWCASIGALFARLRQVGRATLAELGRPGDFYTVQNFGPVATLDGINNRRVDGTDLPSRAPVCDMAMCEEMLQPGMLDSGVIISNVFAFRWAMAAGTTACTLLYHVTDDRAADLAHAEVAVGGGGAFVQCCLFAPESRRRWRRFYAAHADLWRDGVSAARVGILYWSDQTFYEYPEHLALCRALIHILSENQVPFDLVTEEGAHKLGQYDVVFAPMLRYLSDDQIETVLGYARGGGNLVAVSPFGTEDHLARPRPEDPLGSAPSNTTSERVFLGNGTLLRLAPAAVPERRSDLWRLMEHRANDRALAHEWLNEARREDLAAGVDLGAGFVARLEDILGASLRWCPECTCPAVYLHPYHLPAADGRPERLVVHVVNYNMPVLPVDEKPGEGGLPVSRAGDPIPVENLSITIPLPAGRAAVAVKALSPVEACESPRLGGRERRDSHNVIKSNDLQGHINRADGGRTLAGRHLTHHDRAIYTTLCDSRGPGGSGEPAARVSRRGRRFGISPDGSRAGRGSHPHGLAHGVPRAALPHARRLHAGQAANRV